MHTKKYLAAYLSCAMLFISLLPSTGFPNTSITKQHVTLIVDRFFRTELYFGLLKRDGSVVTEDEWKDFLDKQVTPRFPDGFTVLDGSGQYRDKKGVIAKERSKVLIVLYSKKDRNTGGAKLDEIRAAYVKQFNQESVMRMDIRNSVDVSF